MDNAYDNIQAIADALTDDINTNNGLSNGLSLSVPGLPAQAKYRLRKELIIDDAELSKPYKLPLMEHKPHPRIAAIRQAVGNQQVQTQVQAQAAPKPELIKFGIAPRELEV